MSERERIAAIMLRARGLGDDENYGRWEDFKKGWPTEATIWLDAADEIIALLREQEREPDGWISPDDIEWFRQYGAKRLILRPVQKADTTAPVYFGTP